MLGGAVEFPLMGGGVLENFWAFGTHLRRAKRVPKISLYRTLNLRVPQHSSFKHSVHFGFNSFAVMSLRFNNGKIWDCVPAVFYRSFTLNSLAILLHIWCHLGHWAGGQLNNTPAAD